VPLAVGGLPERELAGAGGLVVGDVAQPTAEMVESERRIVVISEEAIRMMAVSSTKGGPM
jgi:hypothetical protein